MRTALTLSTALFLAAMAYAQPPEAAEMKKGEEPVVIVVRTSLPRNWAKLGLTQGQKDSVYEIRKGYAVKKAMLERQIEQLKTEEAKEMAAVLTPEQKATLEKLLK